MITEFSFFFPTLYVDLTEVSPCLDPAGTSWKFRKGCLCTLATESQTASSLFESLGTKWGSFKWGGKKKPLCIRWDEILFSISDIWVNLHVTIWLPVTGHLPEEVWGLNTFCQVYYPRKRLFSVPNGCVMAGGNCHWRLGDPKSLFIGSWMLVAI